MAAKKEIVLTSDGQWKMRQVQEWDVPSVEQDMQKEALKAGFLIPGMAPHTYVHYRGCSVIVLRELEGISFKCAWSALVDPKKGNVVIYPAFRDPNSVKLADAYFWKCPANMRLFVGLNLLVNAGFAITSVDKMCLIATMRGSKGLYRLPLPNVHDDGMLCTGPLPHVEMAMGVDLIMKTCWEGFLANDWNQDLLRNEAYRDMFRFGKAGETLEPNGDWEALCGNKISNLVFNDTFSLVLNLTEKGA